MTKHYLIFSGILLTSTILFANSVIGGWILALFIIGAIVYLTGSHDSYKKKKVKLAKNETIDQIKKHGFSLNHLVYTYDGKKVIGIDAAQKKFVIGAKEDVKEFNVADVYEITIEKDGKDIYKNTLGRTVVGFAVGGLIGAAVGANTSKNKEKIKRLYLQIVLRDGINIYKNLIYDAFKSTGSSEVDVESVLASDYKKQLAKASSLIKSFESLTK